MKRGANEQQTANPPILCVSNPVFLTFRGGTGIHSGPSHPEFTMSSPTAAEITASVLVIGDEILSGRTKDSNIGTIAEFCTEIGIALREVRVVADDLDDIVGAVNALRKRYTYVFTTGGIGPTHDDITAEAVAAAFGVALPVNAEARHMLESQYKSTDVSPARLRMARIPEGASLIPNFVSGAPGFTMENVHVMAGVPKIMQAMLESLSGALRTGTRLISKSISCGVGESTISEELGIIQLDFPDVKIGSYPQMGKLPIYTHLVLRSADTARLDSACARVQELVDRIHAERNITLPEEISE